MVKKLTFQLSQTDHKAVNAIKFVEQLAINFALLSNGFNSFQLIKPFNSRDHVNCDHGMRVKQFTIMVIMLINTIRCLILCFPFSDSVLINLGDFFHDHPNRLTIYTYFTIYLFSATILRQLYISLDNQGNLWFHSLYPSIYQHGFTSKSLSLSNQLCSKYRFVGHFLANFWSRISIIFIVSPLPVSLFLWYSSTLPRSWFGLMVTSCWTFIFTIGLIFSASSLSIMAATTTLSLAYFYYRCDYVSNCLDSYVQYYGQSSLMTINRLSLDKNSKEKTKILDERIQIISSPFSFLSSSVVTHSYDDVYYPVIKLIITYHNQIESVNNSYSIWLMVTYTCLSVNSDFGYFSCFIVHVDRSFLDAFVFFISTSCFIGLIASAIVIGNLWKKVS